MVKGLRDLRIAREKTSESLQKTISEANQLWYGVLRLAITLSSSFLLLTLAFVEKLFREDISTCLKLSWIFLFLTIITGLIAEIDIAIFHGNIGREDAKILKEIDEKLSQGKTQDIIDLPENYLVDGPVFWGTICINNFVFSILLLGLALAKEIFSHNVKLVILILGILIQVVLTIHLLSKRRG